MRDGAERLRAARGRPGGRTAWLARSAAAGRLLASAGRQRRRIEEWTTESESRGLQRRRRLARAAGHRRRGLRRAACGRWSRAAIEFAIGLQTPRGEIIWRRHEDGTPDTYALLTGSSSMYQSLRCAIALAEHLGDPQPDWELAAALLGHAVACHRRGVRGQEPVLDGLVLPGARRRRARRRGRAACSRRAGTPSWCQASACGASATSRG